MAQGGPTLVEVDEVVSEPLRQTQPVQGRFVARQSGPIASRTRGAVMIMHVFVGDAVTAGEPLATLDTARLQAETARKRAEVQYRAAQVDGAIARHEQSEQELDRMEKLRRSAAFSRARFDDQTSEVISAKSHIAEAKAQLETAEAELALAEIDLKNSVVLAPYNGVVTRSYTQAGAYLRDGDPVVDLVDHQSLEIEADIPASRVASLESGMTVTALIEGREPLSATVRAIVPQENTLSRTRAVRFSPTFDPVMVGAAAEAVVTVRVPVGVPRDVVTVHKDAIVQQGGTVVYAVEDGKAVRKRVRLGESAGSRFVVEDGLAPGAMVVIRGNARLRPGQPVTYPGMKPLPGSESGQTPPTATGKPDGAKKDADS
jgi:RND family efflux transporter MFP subunit